MDLFFRLGVFFGLFFVFLSVGCVGGGDVVLTVRLENVSGGGFVQSSGLYEGRLYLVSIETGDVYSLYVCTGNWSWVKQGSCYRFNPKQVDANVRSHLHKPDISGCYVGELVEVDCGKKVF